MPVPSFSLLVLSWALCSQTGFQPQDLSVFDSFGHKFHWQETLRPDEQAKARVRSHQSRRGGCEGGCEGDAWSGCWGSQGRVLKDFSKVWSVSLDSLDCCEPKMMNKTSVRLKVLVVWSLEMRCWSAPGEGKADAFASATSTGWIGLSMAGREDRSLEAMVSLFNDVNCQSCGTHCCPVHFVHGITWDALG